MPAELRAQFDLAEEAVRAMGITAWSMRELEADDALASAATCFASEVEQVRILTPDKDLGQCLEGQRVVQVDRIRDRVLDEAALLVRRGIRPESVPDFLALVGDAADGFPGLAGFGEKTAGALLGRHLHLEQIPADPAAWPKEIRGAAVLAARLQAERGQALLFRRLATLVRDAPLVASLDALRWPGLPRDALRTFAEAFGWQTLVPTLQARPTRWAEG